MMKPLFIIHILFILLVSCHPNDSFRTSGAQEMMLAGKWKFHTLRGDGSNYLHIHPGINDVIIDNNDSSYVEIVGKWDTAVQTRGGIKYWGSDYLISSAGKDSTSLIRFKPEIIEPGYREIFIYCPFGFYPYAKVSVAHKEGIATRFFNQRVKSGNWLSLGVFPFDAYSDNYIEIYSNSGVVADAVMIRPIDASLMNKVKEDKKQIYLTNFDDSEWETLDVPGHWGMLNEYSNYTGKGWYRKTFTLPDHWQKNDSEKITLKFDAVYHLARIFLNGTFIGLHRGGFTPFEFDVTEEINFEKPNTLAVQVDNGFQVGATWNWGGIIRDVHLIRNNDFRIKYQYIHAEPDLKTGEAKINLIVNLENNSSKIRSVKVISEIIDAEGLLTLKSRVSVDPDSPKEIELEGILPADKVKLWHFDLPHLYKMKTSIYEDDKLLHKKVERFGIRKVEVTASGLMLNGEIVRLAGLNRVSDQRYWGNTEPPGLLAKDVDLMKNAGVNFTRIMHGTQNEKLIELCDEKGIMIFEEVNVRDLQNPEFTAPDYPLVKQWLHEMIERDINHPSIIGWSVGNELSDHYYYTRDMISYVRSELDPHRLLTCVSNTGHLQNVNAENDPITFCDIIMQNCYHKTPELMIQTIHERWPDKPIFFSEFSPRRYSTTSLDEDLPELSAWFDVIRGEYPFVIGGSLWTFDDYRSAYIETTAEENRTWGLVNTWRQKRRSYDRMQQENSPVKSLLVHDVDMDSRGANIQVVTKMLSDYPAYTLKKHYIKWEFYDVKGNILEEGKLLLRDLAPGDTWNGKLEWKVNHENAYSLNVEVCSQGGFIRSSKKVFFKVPDSPVINHVINGDGKVRVLFDKVFGAEEYFVRCFEGKTKLMNSKRTIMNFCDVGGLENEKEYLFQVVALNSKGESIASKKKQATPDGKPLPPVIWDAFIDNGKLVIGYSSEVDDQQYTVKYGKDEAHMDHTFTSNVKGMITIDLKQGKSCAFKINRIKGKVESNWSNTRIIE